MQLHQLFYISHARRTSPVEVQSIVGCSRERNTTLKVTGALVFSGAHFAQMLEGLPNDLEALMRSIRRDPRHTMLWEWPSRPATSRWYPEWSMGYLQNDHLEAVVAHLALAPLPLPPLDYFVRWLISTSRLHRRSPTLSQSEA